MGIDYFDEKILCIPNTLYYVGVRDTKDTESQMHPLTRNCNPIHHFSLKEAVKARNEFLNKNSGYETRIYKVVISEVEK